MPCGAAQTGGKKKSAHKKPSATKKSSKKGGGILGALSTISVPLAFAWAAKKQQARVAKKK